MYLVYMDSLVIKNAIGTLDEIYGDASRALLELSWEFFGGRYDDGLGYYQEPREALEGKLEELYNLLLVVLEAAQMPDAKAELTAKWSKFCLMAAGISHIEKDDEHEVCLSAPLNYLKHLLKALRITVSQEITTEQAWELNRLEAILRDTHGLVHRKGNPPANELDIQAIMHDYLSVFFPGFVRNPTINGTIKNFIPDCGIPRLSAAIEFKIAHTEQDVKVAFSGLAEDTAGYKDPKWKRFYAVVYQAKPFVLDSHLQSDMQRIGATTWKVFLVNGDTKPKLTKKRAPKKTHPKTLTAGKVI
jgi:hypothetical protein